MTPRAVPQAEVASDPVLQWVSTLSRGRSIRASSQSAPSRDSSRLAASSSVATRRAATSTASRPASISGRTWSTPQARLTAVGRACRTRSTAAWTCASCQPSRAPSSIASTTPSAPATPRAGAPRTASSAIATTSSSVVRISRYVVVPGSRVWSSSRTPPRPSRPASSSHSMAISVMAAAYAAPPHRSRGRLGERTAVPLARFASMTPEPRTRRRTLRRSTAATLLTLAVVAAPVAVTASSTGAVGAEPTVLTPIGGGYEDSTLTGFARAAAAGASGPSIDIVVVPAAYGHTDKDRKANLVLAQQRTDQIDAACDAAVPAPFTGCTATLAVLLDRADAQDPANSAAIASPATDGIYVLGGDQGIAMQVLASSPAESAITAALHRGVALGGTSAGAAVQSRSMINGYTGSLDAPDGLRRDSTLVWWGDDPDLERGLDAGSTAAIFDQHFYQRG